MSTIDTSQIRYTISAAEDFFWDWADEEGVSVDSQEEFDRLFGMFVEANDMHLISDEEGDRLLESGSMYLH